MDYFSPRTPAGGPGGADGGRPGSGDSYFGGEGSSEASASSNVSSQAAMHPAFGPATAIPFKFGASHSTAFPVQNGATAAFQQALLQRNYSSSSLHSSTSLCLPPQTPAASAPGGGGSGHGLGFGLPHQSPLATSNSLTINYLNSHNGAGSLAGEVAGSSSPRLTGKRHHHQDKTSHKSVRTPIISSPRKLDSLSPSNSAASSSGSEASTPAPSQSQPVPMRSPAVKGLPKVSLSLATPGAHKTAERQSGNAHQPARGSSLPSDGSETSGRSGPLPAHLQSQRGHSLPIGGASIIASGVRRGSAVISSRFKAITPDKLLDVLQPSDKAPPLVLDLRPHTAFVSQGRIRDSINVCVPSTLLRRPNFGLSKINETLCTKRERNLFATALNLESISGRQTDSILVLDQESAFLSQENITHALLSKLEKQGFKGNLLWLKGGFNGLSKFLEDQTSDGHHPLERFVDWHVVSETETEESEDEAEEDVRMQDGSGTKTQLDTQSLEKVRSASSSFSSGSGPGSTTESSFFPSSVGSSSTSFEDAASNKGGQSRGFDSKKLALPFMPRKSKGFSDGGGAVTSAAGVTGSSLNTSKLRPSSSIPIIRPKQLPMSAFQASSTAAGANSGDGSAYGSDGDSMHKMQTGSSRSRSPAPSLTSIDDNAEYPMPDSKGEMRAFNRYGRKQAANPFFDNIRQNLECQTLEATLAHAPPMEIPSEFTSPDLVPHLPDYLQDLVRMTPRSRARKVHTEFFDIEQHEQQRLQNVLDWHCSQASGPTVIKADQEVHNTDKSAEQYHPFSISAGVEKGHLNRYKNMWPYEHARVRLNSRPSPSMSDYINASHIRFRGTNKHYIASQGPLESTIEHFWHLVLQEHVSTIVMLTLLAEGGREKCVNYFKTGDYGTIAIKLKEEKGDLEAMKQSVQDNFGFFGMEAPLPDKSESSVTIREDTSADTTPSPEHRQSKRLDAATVRRVIEVRDKRHPENPVHIVRHIQYIRWPDFDIPPDPNCVIDLIDETARAQQSAEVENAPVLVHCSAGVGRTGTFIAVDTLLERFKRDIEKKGASHGPPVPQYMDVDHRSASPAIMTPSAGRKRISSNSETMQAMSLDSDAESYSDAGSSLASGPSRKSTGESTSALIAKLEQTDLLPEDHTEPVKALVDQMREQRMSSVANAGQYVFTYLALLAGVKAILRREALQ